MDELLFAVRISAVAIGFGVIAGRATVSRRGATVEIGVILAGISESMAADGATTSLGIATWGSNVTGDGDKPIKFGGDGLAAKNAGFGSGTVTGVVWNGTNSGLSAVSCSAADFKLV